MEIISIQSHGVAQRRRVLIAMAVGDILMHDGIRAETELLKFICNIQGFVKDQLRRPDDPSERPSKGSLRGYSSGLKDIL